MTDFEYYKRLVREHKLTELSKEVAEILSRKKLYPVMNDTKWLELQKAVGTLPFPPTYNLRCVTDEDDHPTPQRSGAPRYYGNWSSYWEEGLPPFFCIEWMKVIPRFGKYRGQLIADEIIDETDDFIAILEKHSIPYENDNGTITIYGYR